MAMNSMQLKGVMVDKNKDIIIKKYVAGIEIYTLANEHNVGIDMLLRRLKEWGIKIRKGDFRHKPKEKGYYRKKFRPELQAKMKENTRINNKYIKFYSTVETGKDKFLVRNILRKLRAAK